MEPASKNERLMLQFINEPEFQSQVSTIVTKVIATNEFQNVVAQIFKSTIEAEEPKRKKRPRKKSQKNVELDKEDKEPVVESALTSPTSVNNNNNNQQTSQIKITSPQGIRNDNSPTTGEQDKFSPKPPPNVSEDQKKIKMEEWESALKQIHEMGFLDDDITFGILEKNGGNFLKTLEELLASNQVPRSTT
eukprot:TRINITY_DN3080_c0_g2_i2.p1 TRINITY_DN3080_c0_g2~~TRINITY_DN3080_c0_g2_i2.p1  ORF type:complete len:191 (+),score=58.48 TRINITY_DN3080_c0_g2_i2:194-766(+)